jgi:hypothetical protein
MITKTALQYFLLRNRFLYAAHKLNAGNVPVNDAQTCGLAHSQPAVIETSACRKIFHAFGGYE